MSQVHPPHTRIHGGSVFGWFLISGQHKHCPCNSEASIFFSSYLWTDSWVMQNSVEISSHGAVWTHFVAKFDKQLRILKRTLSRLSKEPFQGDQGVAFIMSAIKHNPREGTGGGVRAGGGGCWGGCLGELQGVDLLLWVRGG